MEMKFHWCYIMKLHTVLTGMVITEMNQLMQSDDLINEQLFVKTYKFFHSSKKSMQ